jgi:hypothetical protein
MAQIALEVQNNAPQDPLATAASVDSSFSEALDTVSAMTQILVLVRI